MADTTATQDESEALFVLVVAVAAATVVVAMVHVVQSSWGQKLWTLYP